MSTVFHENNVFFHDDEFRYLVASVKSVTIYDDEAQKLGMSCCARENGRVVRPFSVLDGVRRARLDPRIRQMVRGR